MRLGKVWNVQGWLLPFLLLSGMLITAVGCASRQIHVDQYRMAPYRPDVPSASLAVRPSSIADDALPESRTRPESVAGKRATPGHDQAGAQRTGVRMLLPGTRVEVLLRGIPEPESFTDQVDERGEITLPHLGALSVAHMSASQAERFIEKNYIDRQIFRSVNVIIATEDEEYFIQGEVRRPGKYGVTRDLTLMQAISEAGGFTPFADRRRVRIMREDGSFTVHSANAVERGNSDDPSINPKDIINVQKSLW